MIALAQRLRLVLNVYGKSSPRSISWDLLGMGRSAIVVILALADLVRHNLMNAMALLFILHSDGR